MKQLITGEIMWNFLRNIYEQANRAAEQFGDLFRLIPASQRRTVANVANGPQAPNNLNPNHIDFDPSQLQHAINLSFGNAHTQPPAFNLNAIQEDEEVQLAMQVSLNTFRNEQPEETTPEAFIKLRQFLELIGVTPTAVEKIAEKFNGYVEECYTTAASLRDGKSLEEITNEFMALSNAERAKLTRIIQRDLDDPSASDVNIIGGLIQLFLRSTRLAVILSMIPDAVPAAVTTAPSSSLQHDPEPVVAPPSVMTTPAVVVFSPSAPMPVSSIIIEPSSSSSSTPVISLTPEQNRRIAVLETNLIRRIRFELKKDHEEVDPLFTDLKAQVDYAGQASFEAKINAIKRIGELIDGLKLSMAPAAQTPSSEEYDPKRSCKR